MKTSLEPSEFPIQLSMPTEEANSKNTAIGWLKFSFIVYFTVCGGSFG